MRAGYVAGSAEPGAVTAPLKPQQCRRLDFERNELNERDTVKKMQSDRPASYE